MHKTTLLVLAVAACLCAGVVVVVYNNPAWTPRALSWRHELLEEDACTTLKFIGPPYGSIHNAEVTAVLPIRHPNSFGLASSGIWRTGWHRGMIAEGSRRFQKYHGGGVLEFGYDDYRLKLLRGGNAFQVGDDIVELKPGDQARIDFTSPSDYTVSVNGVTLQ